MRGAATQGRGPGVEDSVDAAAVQFRYVFRIEFLYLLIAIVANEEIPLQRFVL